MAWNEPGDNKKKDPWGSGGDEPPDLEEVFKNLQNRLKGIFGGGGNSSSDSTKGGPPRMMGIVIVLIGAVVVWGVMDSWHVVGQSQRGLVLRFGEFHRMVQPGLNFTIPNPVESMELVDVAQVRSMVDKGQMLTRDEFIVRIDFSVQYRIKDAHAFTFNVTDPELTLKQAAESALRQMVGGTELDEILTLGREQLSAAALEQTQFILDSYAAGIEVTSVNLTGINPPQQVQEAFDDAIKAREDRETFENEAEAYANSVVPQARGDAERILQDAQGYKAKVVALADGEAQRFELILAQYSAAPEVTRDRMYLDAMEAVLSKSSKLLIGVEGGNNLMYLPLDKLMEKSSLLEANDGRINLPNSGTTLVTPRNTGRIRESGRLPREGR